MASPPRDLILRTLAAGTAAGAAAISLRALARPLPAGERTLVDWEAVRAAARMRTGETGPQGVAGAEALGVAYDAMAAELAPLVSEVVQTPVAGYPPFAVLDRRGFIDANLVMARRLLEPLERVRGQLPESRATALGRTVMSRYMGELFGFLSRRVLGQYDPVLMLAPAGERAGSALLLVEPNVRAFERRQALPAESLRRWLVLHELTHAWQFETHPWLREHLASIMRDLLGGELLSNMAATLEAGSPRTKGQPNPVLRGLVPAVRGQLQAVARVQAVMSVAEGHGNFVMHRVGRAHITDFEQLELGFHQRASQRSLLEQLVLIVTGLRMKMRQYELGERFAESVTQRGGVELLNAVWNGPESLPTLAELREPERWIRRVG
ncbi:MAG TPA: zinc-dependent metalloprotease [Candidatus Dormibacteraeota bacterium]